MAAKDDIINKINEAADVTGDSNIRAALGAPGDVVELSTGEKVQTGLAFDESEAPKTFSVLIEGIANYLAEAGQTTIKKITGNYTVKVTEQIVQFEGALSANVTVTLPAAAAYGSGKRLLVKINGAIGAYILSIVPQSGETIDGAVSEVIAMSYGWRGMYSDGEKWLIDSSN